MGELPLTNNIGVELAGVALEEERRLVYVAMTRARERLILSHVKTLQKQAPALNAATETKKQKETLGPKPRTDISMIPLAVTNVE